MRSLTLSPDEIQLQRGGGGVGVGGPLQLLCFSAPKLLLSWPKINLFPAFGWLESPVKCHTGSHWSKLWPSMGFKTMLTQHLAEVLPLALDWHRARSVAAAEDRGLSMRNRDQKYDSSMNTLVADRAHYLRGRGGAERPGQEKLNQSAAC